MASRFIGAAGWRFGTQVHEGQMPRLLQASLQSPEKAHR